MNFPSCATEVRGENTPWTGHQSVTGNTHSLTHTPTSEAHMVLGCGRKEIWKLIMSEKTFKHEKNMGSFVSKSHDGNKHTGCLWTYTITVLILNVKKNAETFKVYNCMHNQETGLLVQWKFFLCPHDTDCQKSNRNINYEMEGKERKK